MYQYLRHAKLAINHSPADAAVKPLLSIDSLTEGPLLAFNPREWK